MKLLIGGLLLVGAWLLRQHWRQSAQARMLLLTASRERFEDEARWVAADPALADLRAQLGV